MEEKIDYLITEIISKLTNINNGVKEIEIIPTNEIHNCINSLGILFNIKHNLLDK